ncbi:MAG: EAL domain-containing protein [Methylobacteriaceae bacterium]|nr:EAL domain-containing protein [Methylobacteriaceae bacterium]
MKRFLNWAGASHRRPEVRRALARAQYAAYVHQAPILYFTIAVVVGAAVSVCASWDNPLPTIIAPSALVLACFWRMTVWLRRRNVDVDADTMTRRLVGASRLATVMATCFTAWVTILYFTCDPALRGVIAGVFGISTLAAVYSLVNFPISALLVAAVCVPFVSLQLALATPEPMIVGACGLFVVMFGTTFAVVRSSRDFLGLVAAQVDAQQLSDENSRIAHIDSLTGLPNRRQFFERLEAAVARNFDGGRFYVGILDLDGFKPVNDVFGHVIGDRVLVECSARFLQVAGGEAFVARLGGDEFGLIVENVRDEDAVLTLGARICEATREPFAFDDAIAAISTSIGFAAYPDAGDEPSRLYERADFALYFAKQNHRGRAVAFSEEHERRMKGAALVEQCLRRADLDAEMSLEFQPLHDAETGAIVSFEALARWDSPDLGRVSPAEFVPVAERSDIIYPLSRTLLRKALAAASLWPDDVQLSFNLSARDLMSPAALTQIIAIAASGPIAPSRIDFEITETALVTDFERARKAVLALKSIGASISLDDFGTGYSSLNYVHRLPLDRIKIDGGFVREMETSPLARDVVRTMISMARNLNFDCVIEGVETEEQLALLKTFGCSIAQGYLFSRPLPADQVAPFIAARRGIDLPLERKIA